MSKFVFFPVFLLCIMVLTGCTETEPKAEAKLPCYSEYLLPWSYKLGEVKVAQSNNMGPTHNDNEMEYAYDFSLLEGQEVLASRRGVVSYVEKRFGPNTCNPIADPSYYKKANYVVIDHKDGTSAVYMHLSEVSVDVGDNIKQGEIIGKAGKTGYTSCTPHLHYQVQKTSKSYWGQSILTDFAEVAGCFPKKGDKLISANGRDKNSMVLVKSAYAAEVEPTLVPTQTDEPEIDSNWFAGTWKGMYNIKPEMDKCNPDTPNEMSQPIEIAVEKCSSDNLCADIVYADFNTHEEGVTRKETNRICIKSHSQSEICLSYVNRNKVLYEHMGQEEAVFCGYLEKINNMSDMTFANLDKTNVESILEWLQLTIGNKEPSEFSQLVNDNQKGAKVVTYAPYAVGLTDEHMFGKEKLESDMNKSFSSSKHKPVCLGYYLRDNDQILEVWYKGIDQQGLNPWISEDSIYTNFMFFKNNGNYDLVVIVGAPEWGYDFAQKSYDFSSCP